MPELAELPATLAQMPTHARVWVYKCASPFNARQKELVAERGQAFAASWAAHGAPLNAAVEVLYDHFVVVAVDERKTAASGCSIDSSVRFIQQLESALGLSLTDRMVVAYEHHGMVRTCRATDVEALLRAGELTPDTLVYDDLVATVGDLAGRFKVPLKATWLARYR